MGLSLPARIATMACALALVASGARAANEPDAAPAEQAPARVVTYKNDALTVRLSNVNLSEVLADFSRESGAQIRGEIIQDRPVSAEFDAIPLSDGLKRLLGDQNFALVYGEGGRLRAVKLLGGPQAPTTPKPAATAAASPPASAPARPQANIQNLIGLLATHPPIPISGRLQQIIGSPTAPLVQVLELSIQNEDAVVRGEAVRASLQVLETDPQLRATFMQTLNNIDEAELASYMRGVAGTHAEDTMQQIMSSSRGSDFRIKASTILSKLKAQN